MLRLCCDNVALLGLVEPGYTLQERQRPSSNLSNNSDFISAYILHETHLAEDVRPVLQTKENCLKLIQNVGKLFNQDTSVALSRSINGKC